MGFTKSPTYNISLPTSDIKGKNAWYRPLGKVPKSGVILVHGDQTSMVLFLNEHLPFLAPFKRLSFLAFSFWDSCHLPPTMCFCPGPPPMLKSITALTVGCTDCCQCLALKECMGHSAFQPHGMGTMGGHGR